MDLLSRKGEVQKQLARDVLQLSDCSLYQDVTLICSDGSLKLNSFLLAAVFPVFRDILVEVAHYEEEMAISLPSVVSDEIKNFFDELLKEELFYVGDSIKFLFLTSSKPISVNKSPDFNKKINVKEEDENDAKIEIFETEEKVNCDLEGNLKSRKTALYHNRNYNKHLWKEEAVEQQSSYIQEDEEVDFSELDPLCDDIKLDNDNDAPNPKKASKFKKIKPNSPPKQTQHEKAEQQRYSCDICGHTFKKKVNLQRHKSSRCMAATVECDKCNKKFKQYTFSQHKCFWVVPPEKKVCTICGKGVFNLKQHIEQVHENKPVQCPICGKSFKGKVNLTIHLVSHEEKQCCPICGINVRSIKAHIKTVHTSDDKKRFPCQDCEKGFINESYLQKHRINVHLKTYPYHCRYGCDAKYNDTSNRNSHEKKKHGGLFKKSNI